MIIHPDSGCLVTAELDPKLNLPIMHILPETPNGVRAKCGWFGTGFLEEYQEARRTAAPCPLCFDGVMLQ